MDCLWVRIIYCTLNKEKFFISHDIIHKMGTCSSKPRYKSNSKHTEEKETHLYLTTSNGK